MTEQEKQNLARIIAMAKEINKEDQKRMVQQGDIQGSIQLANNEAIVDAKFRSLGVEVP